MKNNYLVTIITFASEKTNKSNYANQIVSKKLSNNLVSKLIVGLIKNFFIQKKFLILTEVRLHLTS